MTSLMQLSAIKTAGETALRSGLDAVRRDHVFRFILFYFGKFAPKSTYPSAIRTSARLDEPSSETASLLIE